MGPASLDTYEGLLHVKRPLRIHSTAGGLALQPYGIDLLQSVGRSPWAARLDPRWVRPDSCHVVEFSGLWLVFVLVGGLRVG